MGPGVGEPTPLETMPRPSTAWGETRPASQRPAASAGAVPPPPTADALAELRSLVVRSLDELQGVKAQVDAVATDLGARLSLLEGRMKMVEAATQSAGFGTAPLDSSHLAR